MKKHNKTLKVVAFALLVTLIALILVASTYAKYASEYSGTDTAIVANFSVDSDVTSDSFSIFDVYEADATSEESDVADGTIAPGTGGSFAVGVSNSSEVSVEYTITIEETANEDDVPIEYSLDGTTYYTADDFTAQTASGELAIGSTTTQTATETIYWRWAYEGSSSTNYTTSQTDDTDTALGTADTAPEVEVTVSVEFTQID